MRLAFAPLALVAALSGGCTIHIVEQPASASAWSAPPPPAAVVVQQPAPAPATPSPAAEPPRRVVSRPHPSDFGRVTTPPPSSKPRPTGPREPLPTQPVATRPVTTKPAPKPPAAETPVESGWGRYPYSITKPEPLHPEYARDGRDTKLVRPPVAATR